MFQFNISIWFAFNVRNDSPPQLFEEKNIKRTLTTKRKEECIANQIKKKYFCTTSEAEVDFLIYNLIYQFVQKIVYKIFVKRKKESVVFNQQLKKKFPQQNKMMKRKY